jgi:hypothetical protein
MDRKGRVAVDASQRPTHHACLVIGCPCKADQVVPTRRIASVANAVRTNGEPGGRYRSPEPAWRFVGLPIV